MLWGINTVPRMITSTAIMKAWVGDLLGRLLPREFQAFTSYPQFILEHQDKVAIHCLIGELNAPGFRTAEPEQTLTTLTCQDSSADLPFDATVERLIRSTRAAATIYDSREGDEDEYEYDSRERNEDEYNYRQASSSTDSLAITGSGWASSLPAAGTHWTSSTDSLPALNSAWNSSMESLPDMGPLSAAQRTTRRPSSVAQPQPHLPAVVPPPPPPPPRTEPPQHARTTSDSAVPEPGPSGPSNPASHQPAGSRSSRHAGKPQNEKPNYLESEAEEEASVKRRRVDHRAQSGAAPQRGGAGGRRGGKQGRRHGQ